MVEKVYVGNLPFKYRGKDLKELFSKVGEVEFATVILDKFKRNRSKGFGFVTFVNEADVEKAIAEMNETDVDGRKITVKRAIPKEESEKSKEEKPAENSAAPIGEKSEENTEKTE